MKNLFLLSFLFLPIFLFISCTKPTTTSNNSLTKENYFKVEVIQDGQTLTEKNDVVRLAKKPFKLRLTLIKTKDVFVSASWGKFYYDYPDNKNIFECNDKTLADCRFVSVKTGNEEKFNENKDIYVGNGSYQYAWFYDESMDWHRFDKGVKVEKGIIYAEVTVENIYDMDARDEGNSDESKYNYKIENINKDIYMVFATENYEKGMEHPEELQRQKITLKFE